MSIGLILTSSLKNLPWRTIAIAAMERVPELFQRTMERLQQCENQRASAAAVEAETQARIDRLEGLLLEQEVVIREQAAKCSDLEKRCAFLASRLSSFKIVSGVLSAAVLLLLAFLLK